MVTKEMIKKYSLTPDAYQSDLYGFKVYRTPIAGLFVSDGHIVANMTLKRNQIFIFFLRGKVYWYTTWTNQLAKSYSAEKFHEWFKFIIKREYRRILRLNK